MTRDALTLALKERFGDVLSFVEGAIDLTARVDAPKLVEVATILRDDERFKFDGLMCLSCVDLPPDGTEIVYHLCSYTHGHWLALKARGPREGAHFPTATGVWPVANWFEREAMELFGATFDGHPDPRPLLLYEGWDEGHPMRKGWKGRDFIPMPEK